MISTYQEEADKDGNMKKISDCRVYYID